jgi:predicted CopG family antitoxin
LVLARAALDPLEEGEISYVSDTYLEGPLMHKKLTITVDEEVYEGLHRVVGRQKISQFIETLVRPHVLREDLLAAYRDMAEEEEREAEARAWAEATVGDVADETR